jgi:GntR family transcriptional regulator
MALHINPGDELPIYRQIVRQIEDAIAVGKLAAGEKLLSHRELAAQLVVAPLTVKKAYDELEQRGLIETQRGRGTFVTATRPAAARDEARTRLRDAARRLLTQARLMDVPLEDVIRLLGELEEQES